MFKRRKSFKYTRKKGILAKLSYSDYYTNIFLGVILTLMLLGLTVGYSVLTNSLAIGGEIAVRPDKTIRITNVSGPVSSGGAYETANFRFSHDIISIEGVFPNNDSSLTYTVTITNNTGYDKPLSLIDVSPADPNIEVDLIGFNLGDDIQTGTSETFQVRITSLVGSQSTISLLLMFIFDYNDITAPTISSSSTSYLKVGTQTATLGCSDDLGVTGYYFGTNSNPSDNDFTDITSVRTYSRTETIGSSGSYYFFCKDAAGNVSQVGTNIANGKFTYYNYTVQNRYLNPNGTQDVYTSTNYDLITSYTYLGTSGTTIVPASVYTVPPEGGYIGMSVGAATTTPATLVATNPVLSADNTVYTTWFNRAQYLVTLNSGSGISATSGGGYYYSGETVTINATVSNGYTWANWTGDYNTNTKNYTFTMPSDNVTITANATGNIYHTTLNNINATTTGTTDIWYQFNTPKTVGGSTCYYFTDSSLTTCITNSTITIPTKTNNNFEGYFTVGNGTGTNYVSDTGQIINNLYQTQIGDLDLYAHWNNPNTDTDFNGIITDDTLTVTSTEITGSTDAYEFLDTVFECQNNTDRPIIKLVFKAIYSKNGGDSFSSSLTLTPEGQSPITASIQIRGTYNNTEIQWVFDNLNINPGFAFEFDPNTLKKGNISQVQIEATFG